MTGRKRLGLTSHTRINRKHSFFILKRTPISFPDKCFLPSSRFSPSPTSKMMTLKRGSVPDFLPDFLLATGIFKDCHRHMNTLLLGT